MTTITALIPLYNAAATIGRALESVLAQTVPCDEILVVDDASTDAGPAVVESYAARHASIRLIRMARNGGPAPARNRGFDESRSDWIAILDSDDAWRPGRNAALLAAAERHRADLVFDNFVIYDLVAGKEMRPGFVADFGEKELGEADYWANCRFGRFQYQGLKIFARRGFLDDHGLRYRPDMRYGEDLILYGEALRAGGKAILLSEPYYIYSQRIGEVSGETNVQSHSLPDFTGMANAAREFERGNRQALSRETRRAIDAVCRSLLAGDRLNRARRDYRAGSYLRMASELMHPDVWRLRATMAYRKRVVARQRYR